MLPAPPPSPPRCLHHRSALQIVGVAPVVVPACVGIIASYSLLTLMTAQVCGLAPGEFIHTPGDAHLYRNHLEQARLQISRTPYPLLTMQMNPKLRDLFAFCYEDFILKGYRHYGSIKEPVAV